MLVHGRATREQLAQFYQRAICLCCTSENEGFPNVFLEAWSYGLPVISTLDPDEVIAHKGIGRIATDDEELSLAIRKLLASPEQWRSTSRRARYYYLKNHHAESVMPQFESAFLHVIQGGKSDSLETHS
jgi:glycosyltransferase involved in cell wall biosynthesis